MCGVQREGMGIACEFFKWYWESVIFWRGCVPLVAVVSLRKGSSEPPTHRLRLEELINSSIRFQFLHDGGARRSLVIFLT